MNVTSRISPIRRLRGYRTRPRFNGPSFNQVVPNLMTMIGLCIAIPALVAANWLGRRMEILSSRLDVLVEALEARRR